MKAALMLATLLPAAGFAQDEWVNFIRQNQLDTGVVWQLPVVPKGQAPSPLALETGGALFQLWTIRQSDAQDFLLDQKLVGAYLPSADIRIHTADPYPNICRTRADQPFSVEIEVRGLLAGEGLPDAAKRVLLEHHLASYESGRTSVDPRVATGGTPLSSASISANGTLMLDFAASSLPASDPTQALGEEHFVVHALADGAISQSQIASNFIQIWPVATGRIEGIEPGDTVKFDAPALTVTLDKLYPSSTTYLQIYEGAPVLGTEGKRIEGSILVLDQDTSEDRVIRIEGWESELEKEGLHTLEIVTLTPFGPERLAHVAFHVDRELSINSLLGDIQSSAP